MPTSSAKVRWSTLVRPASDLVKQWKLIGPDESIMGSGKVGDLEHLIHEVAHAALLGLLPFGPQTSNEVGLRLLKTADEGLEEETKTWAVEWFVWAHIDLDELLAWGDLTAAAEVQGCDSSEIEELVAPENLGSDGLYDISLRVVEELKRLTGTLPVVEAS